MKPTDTTYSSLSCQLITEALFRLMEKENFNDITVSQITMEAGVARRTFYLNYESKEEVLDRHYEALIREYNTGMDTSIMNDLGKQSVYFFSFWYKHRDYAFLLQKNGLFHMLVDRFSLYLDQNEISSINSIPEEVRNYSFSYIAGGLWMLLREWLKNDFRESPEMIASIFLTMSTLGENIING